MGRLGHKKSRLGCRQCKARHVKQTTRKRPLKPEQCDEIKPCTNCVRHGVQCSLVTWEPTPGAPNPTASAASGSSGPKRERRVQKQEKHDTTSPSTHTDNPSTASPKINPSEGSSPSSQSDHFPFLSRFIHKSENSQTDLWIRDIEMMHHWTVEALDVLSHREDIHHMWRVEAPKHAVVHTFLMHQMLAFSAFHKTYQNPGQAQEYYMLGIHHQDHGIKGMRKKLQNITPHESPALVASSLLLTLIVFASTGFESKMPMAPDAIEGIMNIFSLMQGMGNVLGLAYLHVVDSFVSPLFEPPTETTPSQPMLQELLRHLPTLISFIQGRPELSEERRLEYLRNIEHFEAAVKLSDPPQVDNRELRFLFMWPLHLEAGILNDIRQRQPGALVILMYYATLLYAAEPLYWFMDGWGNRLLKACYAEIDGSWFPALRWPLSFLQLDPTFDPFMNKDHLPEEDQGSGSGPYAQQPPIAVSYRLYAPVHSLPASFLDPNRLPASTQSSGTGLPTTQPKSGAEKSHQHSPSIPPS